MPKQVRPILVGWSFLAAAVWSLISLPIDYWMYKSATVRETLSLLPFFQSSINFRTLPEFYPIVAVLGLCMLVIGLLFVQGRSSAKTFASICLALIVIGNTALCVRYTGRFGDRNYSFLWFAWVAGISLVAVMWFFLNRSNPLASGQILSIWEEYKTIHWTIFNIMGRIFGCAAIMVGSLIGLWGLRLLSDSNATLSVQGVPTTALAPKMFLVFFAALIVVMGVLFLIAKPYASKRKNG